MKMQVTYDDGRVETYKVKPRHLIAYEDEFGEFSETARSAFTLAHLASDSDETFKEWLAEVDDITGIPEKGDGAVGGEKGEGEPAEPVPTE